MKGNPRVIEILQLRLREELAAIVQYIVHTNVEDLSGFKKLSKKQFKIAQDEMKHSELIIERILFLEGKPAVSVLAPVKIGDSIDEGLKNDFQAELDAIAKYNASIAEIMELKDQDTADLLRKILEDEVEHNTFYGSQLKQIDQIGIQNYLASII